MHVFADLEEDDLGKLLEALARIGCIGFRV